MFKHLQFVAVASLLLLFSGCASVEKQAFNRSANKTIKSITILEPTRAEGFGISILNHPGLSFGLIGATAYAIEMQSKSKSLDEVMKPLNWSLTDALVGQLETELRKTGYLVRRAKFDREKMALIKDYKPLLDNPTIKDSLATDAWLDVQTRDPLYVANSPTADYLPSIGLTARLVSSKDFALLYREDFFYGFSFRTPRLEPVVLESDTKYRFANMDALRQDPKLTLAGAAEGVPLLAQRIAQDIAHDGLIKSSTGVSAISTTTEAKQ
jgi:hypothetical protein